MNATVLIVHCRVFLLMLIVAIEVNFANCQSESDWSLFEADFVHTLPNVSLPVGQDYSSIGHYSGILKTPFQNVDYPIQYWFFKSQSDNWKIEPTIVWLGYYVSAFHGALTGISPIRMHSDGTLRLNQHSWNKKANLLFIETFPMVGFDYANRHQFVQNDTVASQLAFDALKKFFDKYAQLQQNELYLATQGYGSFHDGVLAKKLVDEKFPQNFSGLLIGNGVFNMHEAVNAHFEYIYKMKRDLFDPTFWQNLDNSCCRKRKPCSYLSQDKCTFRECAKINYDLPKRNSSSAPSKCHDFYRKFLTQLMETFDEELKTLDLHNIDEKCVPAVENATCKRYIVTKKIYNWFNMESKVGVREALHIVEDGFWWPGNYSYQCDLRREHRTLHGHLMFLLRNDIRVLLYTGDKDGVVSPFNTKWLLNDLSLSPMHNGEENFLFDQQIVGRKTRFCEGLIHFDITGAGHNVAEDKPGPLLEMVTQILFGDHSTNSVSNWDGACSDQTVRNCTKYCSTEPSTAVMDKYCDFWVDSFNRYYRDYRIFGLVTDPITGEYDVVEKSS